MSSPSGPAGPDSPSARCVMLVGESGAVPSSLVRALDRRGMDIAIVRHAPQVVVELAEGPPSGLSVVVVEPQLQPGIGELRSVVASYYPGVRCWAYRARGAEGPSAFFGPLETGPEPAADAEPPAHVKGAGQRLRSVVVTVDDPHPLDDGPLVSEEELTMLLGPDPVPAAPPPAEGLSGRSGAGRGDAGAV